MTFYSAIYPFFPLLSHLPSGSLHTKAAQKDAAKLDAILSQRPHLQSHTLTYFTQCARFLHPAERSELCHYAGSVLAHSLSFSQIGKSDFDPMQSPSFVASFGSVTGFSQAVMAEAKKMLCAGWVFLCREGRDGALRLCHTQGNNIPDLELRRPIACLDCWEHAYFDRYGGDIVPYIHDWVAQLDWRFLQYADTAASKEA